MASLLAGLSELLGLFVDDGSLAVGLLVWLAVVGLLAPRAPLGAEAMAAILFLGCLAILIENVRRTAQRRRKG
ncbi:MAG: hypothetical protein HYR63_23235 [Proteobacteria bacterium]|nr:hypothetical protein [Pseudomonadota bacterium]MBI3498286.1 hypothetical protein [Pseudomonadota bacterium]